MRRADEQAHEEEERGNNVSKVLEYIRGAWVCERICDGPCKVRWRRRGKRKRGRAGGDDPQARAKNFSDPDSRETRTERAQTAVVLTSRSRPTMIIEFARTS